MHWSIFSIFASFIIATSFLIRKNLLQKHSINNLMFYVYCGLLISAVVFAILIKDKDKEGFKTFDNQTKALALTAGAIIPVAIYFLTVSLKQVKNPAYTSIVFAVFKTILLLSLSIYILNSPYNKLTLFGVLLALLGVVLIILNE